VRPQLEQALPQIDLLIGRGWHRLGGAAMVCCCRATRSGGPSRALADDRNMVQGIDPMAALAGASGKTYGASRGLHHSPLRFGRAAAVGH